MISFTLTGPPERLLDHLQARGPSQSCSRTRCSRQARGPHLHLRELLLAPPPHRAAPDQPARSSLGKLWAAAEVLCPPRLLDQRRRQGGRDKPGRRAGAAEQRRRAALRSFPFGRGPAVIAARRSRPAEAGCAGRRRRSSARAWARRVAQHDFPELENRTACC